MCIDTAPDASGMHCGHEGLQLVREQAMRGSPPAANNQNNANVFKDLRKGFVPTECIIKLRQRLYTHNAMPRLLIRYPCARTTETPGVNVLQEIRLWHKSNDHMDTQAPTTLHRVIYNTQVLGYFLSAAAHFLGNGWRTCFSQSLVLTQPSVCVIVIASTQRRKHCVPLRSIMLPHIVFHMLPGRRATSLRMPARPTT